MYKEIDELIEAIINDEIFKQYQINEKLLQSDQIIPLLRKHQMIQDDYMKMKAYETYVCIDETKQQLKDVKDEISHNPHIQAYYKSYYQLNELLEEITHIVFDGISEDIYTNQWKWG